MPFPPAHTARLAALRAEVRAIECAGSAQDREVLPFEVEAVDRRLEGGGLAAAALHEVAGARPDLSDDAAALLFIAGIAARRAGAVGTILWALARRDLFAPGLQGAGLGPERVLFAECGTDEDVLAVMEEGLRHGGLAAVVGEVGRAAMASSRRLHLAAEEKGTTAFLLRRWRRNGEDPLAAPSAAFTRWRIGCAPSAPLAHDGIGRPCWQVELVRQRGGMPFNLILEGSDAEGRLALPARPAHRPPAADRAAA